MSGRMTCLLCDLLNDERKQISQNLPMSVERGAIVYLN